MWAFQGAPEGPLGGLFSEVSGGCAAFAETLISLRFYKGASPGAPGAPTGGPGGHFDYRVCEFSDFREFIVFGGFRAMRRLHRNVDFP